MRWRSVSPRPRPATEPAADDQWLENFRRSPRPLPPLALKSDAELLAMAIELTAPTDALLSRYMGCDEATARRYRAAPQSIPLADRMRVYGILEYARFHLFKQNTVDLRVELLYEALSGRLRSHLLEYRRRCGDPYATA